MSAGLLGGDFVRELEALRRRLVVRAPSGAQGGHGARRRGASAEFREHRAYAPGDDLRSLDWAAYARSGEPVVKLFRAEEDTLVRLVLDASASLEGPKLERAQRVCAALAYVALCAGERVRVAVHHAGERAGGDAVALRGRAGVPRALRALGEVRASGGTSLAAAVGEACGRGAPGMLVVVSDFFDAGPWREALSRARAAGHDLVLVQVLSPEELRPELEGELLLVDRETGEDLELTADAESLAAYGAALRALCAELAGLARSAGGVYVRSPTEEPLERAVRRALERRGDGELAP